MGFAFLVVWALIKKLLNLGSFKGMDAFFKCDGWNWNNIDTHAL